jgi:hypothetical protein
MLETVHCRYDIRFSQCVADLEGQAFTSEQINNRQCPDLSPISKLVGKRLPKSPSGV